MPTKRNRINTPRTPQPNPIRPALPFQQNYRHQRKRGLFATGVATLVFAAAIGIAGWFSLQAIAGNLSLPDDNMHPSASSLSSTPKNEWTQGVVPTLYQTDPTWGKVPYAGNDFSESGCGPTCMAMVYVALTGMIDRDPAAMAALATDCGYVSEEGTAWSFMTDGAGMLGLAAVELPADEMSIRKSIVAGRPVICSMGPGDFTTVGHFIVLVDINQNGDLIVHDPNSPERTAKTWHFDTVTSQCRNAWSYSLV